MLRQSHVTAHAAQRWANAVIPLIDLRDDPKRLADWQRAIGSSATTLRSTCLAVKWKTKHALDFGRLLRAVHIACVTGKWDPDNLFDVADSRTLRRLLAEAGLTTDDKHLPSIDDLLLTYERHLHPTAMSIIRDALQARASTHALELS